MPVVYHLTNLLALLSDKLLVPFMMIGAFLANVITLIWDYPVESLPLLSLAAPFNWFFFLLQIAFYFLAWLGAQVKYRGSLGKLLYLPKPVDESTFPNTVPGAAASTVSDACRKSMPSCPS